MVDEGKDEFSNESDDSYYIGLTRQLVLMCDQWFGNGPRRRESLGLVLILKETL